MVDQRRRWVFIAATLAITLSAGKATGQPAQPLLEIGDDGTITQLMLGGRDVPLRTAAPFKLRSAGSDTVQPLTYEGRAEGRHLYRLADRYSLTLETTPIGSGVRMDGRIEA